MSEELNRQNARRIAQNQALHPEAQDILEESIFTELQIAQNRGQVLYGIKLKKQWEGTPLSDALIEAGCL